MRILLIAPHEYYIDRGSPIGVDVLVRALSARGETVDLVVYRGGEDRQYPGVTIHRPRTPSWLGVIPPGFSLKKVVADFWLYATVRRLVSRHRYDVVHAGEEAVFFAMWFRVLRHIPYVYDMDSSIAEQMVETHPWLRPLAWLFNWCETRAIRSALATAPVCNALTDHARARGARHITTLHDISQMTPDDLAPAESIREKFGLRHPIVMYVGNLEPYQGIDLLLEAFARVLEQGVPLDLVIAGGSPVHIAMYQQKARRLKIDGTTHFIGPWPAARLGALLTQADIVTAPRIRGINTPMKVFPYLHSGRPVLVTDLPTHTQILDASVCELAAAEPEAFAAALIRLARDPERRRALGQAGRKFVERNHVYAAHKNRVNELYDHVARELGVVTPAPSEQPRGASATPRH